MKENPVAQRVQLEWANLGGLPMRNNVGACEDATGRFIRYGLMNESAKMNAQIKSSDYIGITPTLITPQMVGYYLGVFTAIETKASDWKFSQADQRAVAQARFHDIVRAHCGFAGFATGPDDVRLICRR